MGVATQLLRALFCCCIFELALTCTVVMAALLWRWLHLAHALDACASRGHETWGGTPVDLGSHHQVVSIVVFCVARL